MAHPTLELKLWRLTPAAFSSSHLHQGGDPWRAATRRWGASPLELNFFVQGFDAGQRETLRSTRYAAGKVRHTPQHRLTLKQFGSMLPWLCVYLFDVLRGCGPRASSRAGDGVQAHEAYWELPQE